MRSVFRITISYNIYSSSDFGSHYLDDDFLILYNRTIKSRIKNISTLS